MNFDFLSGLNEPQRGTDTVPVAPPAEADPLADPLAFMGAPLDPVPVEANSIGAIVAQEPEDAPAQRDPWREVAEPEPLPATRQEWLEHVAELEAQVAERIRLRDQAKGLQQLLLEVVQAQKALPSARRAVAETIKEAQRVFSLRRQAPLWAFWVHKQIDVACDAATARKIKAQTHLWVVNRTLSEFSRAAGPDRAAYLVQPAELARLSTRVAKATFATHVAEAILRRYLADTAHLTFTAEQTQTDEKGGW